MQDILTCVMGLDVHRDIIVACLVKGAVDHSIYAFLRKFVEYALPIIPTISGSNQRFHFFFLFVHPRFVFIGCPPLHIRCRIVLLIICLGNPIFTVNADLSTVCILIENICAGCISCFGC